MTHTTYQLNVKVVGSGDVRCYVYRLVAGKSLLTAYTRGGTQKEAVRAAAHEVRTVRRMGGLVRR